MLTVIQSKIPNKVINHIEANRDLLTPDHSNYALGRMRAWIGAEAPLSNNRSFLPTPFSYESSLWKWLYKFCQDNLSFTPEVGLLHVGGADCSDPEENALDGRGGECGIKEHRDAAYADFRAVGINLSGEAVFGYRSVYPEQHKWSKEGDANALKQIVKMTTGTCVIFNCKNPHYASVGPNRWAINAWRISDKRRVEFEEFLRKEN